MWMEQSRDPRLNAGALRSNRLIFVSSHLGIKIQFRVSQISEALYEDEPAFYLPMPDALLRLQRRDTFRIATPSINPLLCTLPSSEPSKQSARKLAVMDISVGGVRLACNEEDTDLVYGQRFEKCAIELPDVGTLHATIEVRNEVDVSKVPGKVLRRVGCQFKNLDQHDQVMLQRYITELQRAQRAKE
ncbi:MAG: flagellar brake protein, partial [Actinomycetota bacterium]|nr:flagellar brake protein [Actinomycetota bacterium]